jgi:hypothetical protein
MAPEKSGAIPLRMRPGRLPSAACADRMATLIDGVLAARKSWRAARRGATVMLGNKVISIVAATVVLGLAFAVEPADARALHGGRTQRAFHNPGLGALNFGLGSPVFGNCGRNIPYFDAYYGYDPCACYVPPRI